MIENSVANTWRVNNVIPIKYFWVVSLKRIISKESIHFNDMFWNRTLLMLFLFMVWIVKKVFRHLRDKKVELPIRFVQFLNVFVRLTEFSRWRYYQLSRLYSWDCLMNAIARCFAAFTGIRRSYFLMLAKNLHLILSSFT